MRTGVISLNGYRLEYKLCEVSLRPGWNVWVRTSPHKSWTQIGTGDCVFANEHAAMSGVKHTAEELNARRLKI